MKATEIILGHVPITMTNDTTVPIPPRSGLGSCDGCKSCRDRLSLDYVRCLYQNVKKIGRIFIAFYFVHFNYRKQIGTDTFCDTKLVYDSEVFLEVEVSAYL